jgi:PKD repeat protein
MSGTLNACVNGTSNLNGTGTANTTNPWISSNNSIATVTTAGVVTGKAAGTTNITYTNNNGCSIIKAFEVFDLPVANFTNTTNLCAGNTVQFTATTGAGYTYLWDFGDGGTGVTGSVNISYIYSTSGIYSVRLVTTDRNGCKDTIIKTNYIRSNGPVASFSATNTGGCNGLTTTFNDFSTSDGTNAITSWLWNFGDGVIQNFTAPPFTHTYNTIGTFSVTLKVTDASGCFDSVTLNNLIHSTDPFVTFITPNPMTCPGSTVGWVVNAIGTNISLLWDFGDGTTSTMVFPPKSYTAPGVYTVKLYATDYYGCTDSLVRTNYITVNNPVADFSVDDSISSCAPFEVNFTNTSTYSNSQDWAFEPGVTSTLQNPAHYFTTPGVYNVELIITSPGGCKDTTYKTIRLSDTTGSRINYNPFNGCNPLPVNFNVVSNAISTFIWDFGDGQSVVTNTPNISHTYTVFGNYSPKVLMQDPTGCLIPLSGFDTIRIVGAIAKFGIDKNLLCDGGLINFIDSTTFNDPVTNYNWNFGDGGTSTSQTPSHYYNGTGFYNVTLAVQTQLGCRDTLRINNILKVVASPSINISGGITACVASPLQYWVPDIHPQLETSTSHLIRQSEKQHETFVGSTGSGAHSQRDHAKQRGGPDRSPWNRSQARSDGSTEFSESVQS